MCIHGEDRDDTYIGRGVHSCRGEQAFMGKGRERNEFMERVRVGAFMRRKRGAFIGKDALMGMGECVFMQRGAGEHSCGWEKREVDAFMRGEKCAFMRRRNRGAFIVRGVLIGRGAFMGRCIQGEGMRGAFMGLWERGRFMENGKGGAVIGMEEGYTYGEGEKRCIHWREEERGGAFIKREKRGVHSWIGERRCIQGEGRRGAFMGMGRGVH